MNSIDASSNSSRDKKVISFATITSTQPTPVPSTIPWLQEGLWYNYDNDCDRLDKEEEDGDGGCGDGDVDFDYAAADVTAP